MEEFEFVSATPNVLVEHAIDGAVEIVDSEERQTAWISGDRRFMVVSDADGHRSLAKDATVYAIARYGVDLKSLRCS